MFSVFRPHFSFISAVFRFGFISVAFRLSDFASAQVDSASAHILLKGFPSLSPNTWACSRFRKPLEMHGLVGVPNGGQIAFGQVSHADPQA